MKNYIGTLSFFFIYYIIYQPVCALKGKKTVDRYIHGKCSFPRLVCDLPSTDDDLWRIRTCTKVRFILTTRQEKRDFVQHSLPMSL